MFGQVNNTQRYWIISLKHNVLSVAHFLSFSLWSQPPSPFGLNENQLLLQQSFLLWMETTAAAASVARAEINSERNCQPKKKFRFSRHTYYRSPGEDRVREGPSNIDGHKCAFWGAFSSWHNLKAIFDFYVFYNVCPLVYFPLRNCFLAIISSKFGKYWAWLSIFQELRNVDCSYNHSAKRTHNSCRPTHLFIIWSFALSNLQYI